MSWWNFCAEVGLDYPDICDYRYLAAILGVFVIVLYWAYLQDIEKKRLGK